MAELTEKGKEELKQRREDMAKRREAFIERKENMAKRDDTIVVRAASLDIRRLAFSLNLGDIAINRLRTGMGIRYDMKDVADVIEKFDAKSKELVALISDACKKAAWQGKPHSEQDQIGGRAAARRPHAVRMAPG
jgi:ribosomal protein S19E (S16A)